MQSVTNSVPSRTTPSSAWEIFSRLLRHFRSAALAQRPGIEWAEMRPIDFQGEDTSLSQEHLGFLR